MENDQRQEALEECAKLMRYHNLNRIIFSRFYHLSQLSAIFLSGITPILIFAGVSKEAI